MFYGVGRCVADPEVRTTQSGASICSVRVAFDRRIKKENQPTADFFQCYAFGKAAELLEKYFIKGKPIEIQGDVQNRTWDDTNGQKHYVTEILINNLGFVPSDPTSTAGNGGQRSPAQAPAPTTATAAKVTATVPEDDEMPF